MSVLTNRGYKVSMTIEVDVWVSACEDADALDDAKETVIRALDDMEYVDVQRLEIEEVEDPEETAYVLKAEAAWEEIRLREDIDEDF
jgi:Zn-dependent M32 family carboxypeptidase